MPVQPVAGWKWFRLDGIERSHSDPTIVERVAQCVLVYQRTARDIHQMDTGLDRRQYSAVDEVVARMAQDLGLGRIRQPTRARLMDAIRLAGGAPPVSR